MTFKKKIITSAILTSLVLSGCNVSNLDSPTGDSVNNDAENPLPVIQVPKNSENRYVVMYNANAKGTNSILRETGEFSTRKAEKTLSTFSVSAESIVEHLPDNNASVVTLTDEQLNELQAMTLIPTSPIALVEPDVKRKLIQPFFDDSPLLAAESVPYGIKQVQADLVSDQYAANQTLCIIDSGYDIAHDDLQNNNVTGGNTASSAGQWNVDQNSHGTHVAGTIAALGGNGIGVRGVHQSGNLKLHIVKVFTADGWAWGSDLVKAIAQCRDHGAKVVSMSLGGSGASNYERNAMASFYNDDGVLLIAAAGNDGNSANSYPASYDSVMSVAAVDSSMKRANFSQYNAQVEISGPGVSVKSTVPNNRYSSYSGTSMATPHVSAVASLVWSYAPNCNAAELRSAMTSSAKDLGNAGRDTSYGFGLVQALDMKTNLLNRSCASGTGPTDPTDPNEPSIIELTNGTPVTKLSGAKSASLPSTTYRLNVPNEATDLVISTLGGTGDVDLYVRHGSEPELKTYTCRPYQWGNKETCTLAKPDAGDWYITLHAYGDFADVSLTASYTAPSNQTQRVVFENLSAKKGDMLLSQDGKAFMFSVTDAKQSVTIALTKGTGDADLYVRHGSEPTRRLADCKPFKDGNEETCLIEGAELKLGDWYVGAQAFEDFAGVSLVIDIQNP